MVFVLPTAPIASNPDRVTFAPASSDGSVTYALRLGIDPSSILFSSPVLVVELAIVLAWDPRAQILSISAGAARELYSATTVKKRRSFPERFKINKNFRNRWSLSNNAAYVTLGLVLIAVVPRVQQDVFTAAHGSAADAYSIRMIHISNTQCSYAFFAPTLSVSNAEGRTGSKLAQALIRW